VLCAVIYVFYLLLLFFLVNLLHRCVQSIIISLICSEDSNLFFYFLKDITNYRQGTGSILMEHINRRKQFLSINQYNVLEVVVFKGNSSDT